MTEDTTLTEFASARADGADSGDGGDHRGDDERDAVAAGTPTTTFASGEYDCASCGRATERVWRDDGEFVCPACKQW